MSVDDLIAEAKSATRKSRFTPEAVEDLRKIIEHNDRGEGARISISQAREHLKKHRGITVGQSLFLLEVERAFGRSWGGK